LHGDLQARGILCWFASEDLKTGDPFRLKIDEAIRMYDKLLLIASEHSIRSTWVEAEVEAALERERIHKTRVLFPLRIDQSMMETKAAWAAHIRRVIHIANFQGWTEEISYQKALERLIRDLQASHAQDEVQDAAGQS
jgi:hypothetical protein